MSAFKKVIFIVIVIILFFISNSNAQSVEERITDLISQMTLQEKILQLNQEGSMNTEENIRLGIPGLFMADGPHGVRMGMATSFPVGISMAATWDIELIERVGIAMGKEFRTKGRSQALGPCMDLTRDPRNGRSPESGGEDPYLNTKITSAALKGVQTSPIIGTIKHFNCKNNQATRHTNNVIITQRLLMEHYGLNFRTSLQDCGSLSIMSAYNLINGDKASESRNLLTEILRERWGFPFYVVSDWGAIWNTEKAIEAGCDICMGSDNYKNDLANLVNNGAVSISTINDAVRRVLRTKYFSGVMDFLPVANPDDLNSDEHKILCREAGKKSIVLLKNSDNILPLNNNQITKIAVIGPNAAVMQLDGTGSGYVTPFYTITPMQGVEEIVGSAKIIYAKGCDINSSSVSGFTAARNAAEAADVVIFFGGLDQTQEGEGLDRVGGSINLPGKQIELINQLAAVNENVIVVLISGGICGVNDFINNIKGLLYAFYPGQEGGNAIAEVLFGLYNPSGKLPVTMPVSDSQLQPLNNDFTDDYGCGYRWFDEMNYEPQFPFGFGLSYTTFSYSNLIITPSISQVGEIITVSADVTNTGNVEGEEVAQLYLLKENPVVYRPKKELKGFEKISLLPGETKTVDFEITPNELYYFDESSMSYKVEEGNYIAHV
ncbi:MAG: glycoside hydrolase family 3 C-terminal domain-containing protein, partial [bacterium]